MGDDARRMWVPHREQHPLFAGVLDQGGTVHVQSGGCHAPGARTPNVPAARLSHSEAAFTGMR